MAFFVLSNSGSTQIMGHYAHIGLYLFKEVLPQNSIAYIPVYNSCIDGAEYFAVKRKIKKNEFTLHYTLKDVKYMYGYNEGGFINYKPCKSKKLAVKYHYKNGKWNTNDTNKLKKLKNFIWS